MKGQNAYLIDRFYNLYSDGLESGHLSSGDWQVVEAVIADDKRSEEQQDMIQRLLYCVNKGRITIQGVENAANAVRPLAKQYK
ncbi:MAG: hypothetical protein AAGG51_15330 [Cyanobacteria bacterium P01_G01_bin.54]